MRLKLNQVFVLETEQMHLTEFTAIWLETFKKSQNKNVLKQIFR